MWNVCDRDIATFHIPNALKNYCFMGLDAVYSSRRTASHSRTLRSSVLVMTATYSLITHDCSVLSHSRLNINKHSAKNSTYWTEGFELYFGRKLHVIWITVHSTDTIIVYNYRICVAIYDRLCGLVIRVSGYRYRGPGFDPRRYRIFWVVVGLERGPLSLVRSIQELLEWKK